MPKPINKTQEFSFFVQQPSWTFSSRKVPWDHLGSWQQLLLGVPDPGVSRPQKSGKKSELWRCWKKPFLLKKNFQHLDWMFDFGPLNLGLDDFFFKPQKYRGKKWSHVSYFFPQTVHFLGSQCFLSVSALSGMLCSAFAGLVFPACLGTGLGYVWFHMQFPRWCNLGVRSMLRGWGIQVFLS